MRPDQFDRLQQLEERLTDVFISEADPDAWPGAGRPSAKLSAQERKGRYLYKRAASETAMLLVRTQALIDKVRGYEETPEGDPRDDALETEITDLTTAAARDADRMRRELIAKARKTAQRDAQPPAG